MKNIRIFLGSDAAQKKNELLQELARKEGYEPEKVIFYAGELSPRDVEREWNNLSLTRRLFVFKDASSLKKELKECLASLLLGKENDEYVVFEAASEADEAFLKKDAFFKKLLPLADVSGGTSKEKDNQFFDLVNAIRRGDGAAALTCIGSMFGDGKSPAQASGEALRLLKGLTTMLGRTPSVRLKRSYFRVIFETDRILKESLLSPRLALERMAIDLVQCGRRTG